MNSPKWMQVSLFTILAATLGYSQAPRRIRFTVPFDFSIGRKAFPAGEYFVNSAPGASFVGVESRDSRHHIYAPVYPGRQLSRGENGKLLFHRYGDTYFLSSIIWSGDPDSLELGKSAAEREIASKAAKANQLPSEEVVLSGGSR